ncbi:MAG: hypothetical protein Q7R73_00170 [bacterium]|nr:hypothetical protein [bacterium]
MTKKKNKKSIKKITLEGLALLVQKEFLGVRKEFTAVRQDIAGLRQEMERRFGEIEQRLIRLESGYESLRIEVREIKYLLQQKASREELNDLDTRLTKVEMRLKKLSV